MDITCDYDTSNKREEYEVRSKPATLPHQILSLPKQPNLSKQQLQQQQQQSVEETHSKNQQADSKVIEVSKNITIHIHNTTENFRGGKTADKIKIWKRISTDKWVLDTIIGSTLELTDIPKQTFIPKPIKFSSEEKIKIQHELDRFNECGIIERASDDTENKFISNIFIRPKKDG